MFTVLPYFRQSKCGGKVWFSVAILLARPKKAGHSCLPELILILTEFMYVELQGTFEGERLVVMLG